MRRSRTQQTPDLFSTSVTETSPPATKQLSPVQQRRHILPKDLANAVKQVTDEELDLLVAACLEGPRQRRSGPEDLHRQEGVLEANRPSHGLRDLGAAGIPPCGAL